MKSSAWLKAYEDNNVDVGLACGFRGRAQIGKGMWAMPGPDGRHAGAEIVTSGSGCEHRLGPSPTAATLHAIHYHRVDVAARQGDLSARAPAKLSDILTIPLASERNWSEAEVREELDNNVQGFWVMWSAGSTRASAARRCRTSTMSA
jgi:malate synthase